MKLRLEEARKPPPVLHRWRRLRSGNWACGNVLVRKVQLPDRPWPSWLIYVRTPAGGYRRVISPQRPWSYGSAGQAKMGAGLMAAHQRGAYRNKRPYQKRATR